LTVKNFTVKKRRGVLGAYDNASGQLIYGGSTNEGGVNSLNWDDVIQAAIDHVDTPGTVTVEGIDFKFSLDNGVNIPEGVTVYEKFLGRKVTYTQGKGEGHYHVAGDISSGTLNLDRIPSHSSAKHTESYAPVSHYHPCADLTDHGKTLHDLLDIDAGSVEGSTVNQIRDHAPKSHANEAHSKTFIEGSEVPTNETDPTIDATLKGVTKSQIQDHSPKAHEHVESEITDLVHDAVKIKGKEVDDSGIGDGKKLGYNVASGKIEYQTGGTGGMEVHGNEYHEPDFLTGEVDPSVDSTLKGVTKAQVQDHTPKTHSHPESDVTNLVTDLASKETPSGSQAKVDAHKDLSTGIHGVGAGVVSKVGDIAVDSNLSVAAQDAISKKHAQSHTLASHSTKAHNELTDIGENDHHTKFTITEHDVTARHTLGTVVPHDALASLTEKSHTNLTDKGTNTHPTIDTHLASTANPHATTKAQVALTNVTDDAQLKRADGDLNSFTLKSTPVAADILLIEDSAAAFAKKKITVGSLPSGGGSELETVVVATADTPNTTTTLADATGLVCALLANSTYIIEGFIVWSASVATVGIKLSATGPTSPTLLAGHFITDATNGTPDSSSFNANDVTVTTSASAFTVGNVAALHCIVKTGANAGNFQIRFAAETTGTITIKIGSTLRCRKVA